MVLLRLCIVDKSQRGISQPINVQESGFYHEIRKNCVKFLTKGISYPVKLKPSPAKGQKWETLK